MALSASLADSGHGKRPALTREKVIERLRRWEALYGEPPGTADWNPSVARWRAQEWRVARYRLGDPETGEPWPSTTAAKRRFGGSWDAAVRAAGFEPRRSGPRPAGLPAHLHAVDPLPGEAGTAGPAAPPVAEVQPRGPLPARPRAGDPAERRAAAEARRAERAREDAGAARVRAKRHAEQARRAKAAREREVERRLDAEAHAAALRGRVAELEAERAAAAAGPAGVRAHLASPADRLAGPAVLGAALTALAAARREGDRVALAGALAAVERAAGGWRERL